MKTYKFITMGLMAVATLGLTSCSDADDEIESLVFDRIFSPVGLEANNVKEISATLSWTPSSGAAYYNVEVYQDDSLSFTSTTKFTKTTTASSLSISGLVYDTQYSARVQAVDSADNSRDSKWSTVYFRTDAQQIFNELSEDQIADRSVSPSWPAGETVTQLVVKNAAGNVVSTHDITDAELAAGTATADGLQPETTYTVYLLNNGKQRGSRTFTTIADLNGATIVRPGADLKSLLENATDGQVFALYGGTYTLSAAADDEESVTAGAATISKTITIKGIYPTNLPTINGRLVLIGGAGLTMSQVKMDGTGTSGDQAFNYKEAGTYAPLSLQNVEVANYTKGFYYINVAATIENITINNCLIHDIECDGGDLFDCRKGYIKTLTLSNSTIYNCAQKRDFIRYDDSSASFGSPVPTIVVNHNTINNCLNETDAKRLLYVRFNGKGDGQLITWSNNLVTNTKAVFTNQSTTSTPTYSGNYYFNCQNANLFAPTDKANKLYYSGDTDGSNGEDPSYADAAKGNFTIGNESVSKLGVGDPRWIK